MNVQELIDELQKVEDKSKQVILSQGNMAFNGIVFHKTTDILVSENKNSIWVSNTDGSVENYIKKYGAIR